MLLTNRFTEGLEGLQFQLVFGRINIPVSLMIHKKFFLFIANSRRILHSGSIIFQRHIVAGMKETFIDSSIITVSLHSNLLSVLIEEIYCLWLLVHPGLLRRISQGLISDLL